MFKFKTALQARLAKDAVWNSVFVILGKASGFFIPVLLARTFGASTDLDLFFLTYGIIFFMAVLMGDSARSILPSFIAERAGDDAACFRFLNAQIFVFSLLTLSLYAVGTVVLVPYLKITTGFADDKLFRMKSLFVDGGLFVCLYTMGRILSAYLDVKKIFWAPSIAPVIRSAVVLSVLLVLNSRTTMGTLMVAYVGGEALSLLFIAALIGFKYRWRGPIPFIESTRLFREFLRVAGYQVGVMIVLNANHLVDQTVAARLEPGDISLLEYARVFQYSLFALLITGPSVVWASYLANHGGDEGLNPRRLSEWTFGIGVLLALALFSAKGSLTALMYGQKALPGPDLIKIEQMIGIYCWTIPFVMSMTVASRTLQILKKTKFLFLAALFQFGVNLAGDLLFSTIWGLQGVVVSSVVTLAIGAFLLNYFLYKNARALGPDHRHFRVTFKKLSES